MCWRGAGSIRGEVDSQGWFCINVYVFCARGFALEERKARLLKHMQLVFFFSFPYIPFFQMPGVVLYH